MLASISAPELAPIVTDEPSLVSLAGQAIDEGKTLVTAEVALFKAKVSERVSAYRGAVVMFAIAGVLTLAALIALLVGLILTLSTLIGPGGATATVVGVVLIVAGVFAIIGKGRLASPAVESAA